MRRLAATALGAVALLGLVIGPAHADARPHTMPDVTGMRLPAAFKAVDYDPSAIRYEDGLGTHRHVLWPPDWKVCSQRPAPGTPLNNVTVTLTVVKTNETCR